MKSINVLIIANYYYPDVASIANLYKQLAEYLAYSMNVTVLCAVPCYEGSIPAQYKNGKYFIEKENNVNIVRVNVPNYNKNSKISRIKNLQYFISRAIHSSKRIGKQDVIIAVSQPPVLGGYVGYRLKKKLKAKLIYNIQDFNPEQMEYSGFSKNSIIIGCLRFCDNYICRRADAIITVSSEMQSTLYKRLKNKKVPKNYVINNWVDTEKIKNVERIQNPLLKKYGLNIDDFLVVYAGNIGIMQNLKTFVVAASKLQNYTDIKFVFIGSGAWREKLSEMIKELGINNIILKPYEPIENIDSVYSLGDIEIVSIGKNVTKCSMPSKTWNILSCGVPVICQVDPDSELNRLINDNEIGYTITPDDCDVLVQRILELYESAETRKKMGINARDIAVREFDAKKSLQKYKEVILDIC